jgi:hypothetical protein
MNQIVTKKKNIEQIYIFKREKTTKKKTEKHFNN